MNDRRSAGALLFKAAGVRRKYSTTEHTVQGGHNVTLMHELGLWKYLSDFNTIAGPPEVVRPILNGLAERGVSCFIVPLPGHGDPAGTIRRFAETVGLE